MLRKVETVFMNTIPMKFTSKAHGYRLIIKGLYGTYLRYPLFDYASKIQELKNCNPNDSLVIDEIVKDIING
jgi:hypothetical protein